MREIPLMDSLGVLNPSPMDFQKRFPPFPGLFPFPVFFVLRKGPKTTNDSASKHHNGKNKNNKSEAFSRTLSVPEKHFWLLQKSFLGLQNTIENKKNNGRSKRGLMSIDQTKWRKGRENVENKRTCSAMVKGVVGKSCREECLDRRTQKP